MSATPNRREAIRECYNSAAHFTIQYIPTRLPIRGAMRPIHRDTEVHMPLSDLKPVFAEDIADHRVVKENLQCL